MRKRSRESGNCVFLLLREGGIHGFGWGLRIESSKFAIGRLSYYVYLPYSRNWYHSIGPKHPVISPKKIMNEFKNQEKSNELVARLF